MHTPKCVHTLSPYFPFPCRIPLPGSATQALWDLRYFLLQAVRCCKAHRHLRTLHAPPSGTLLPEGAFHPRNTASPSSGYMSASLSCPSRPHPPPLRFLPMGACARSFRHAPFLKRLMQAPPSQLQQVPPEPPQQPGKLL